MNSIKIKAMSEDALLYLLYKNCHLRYSHWNFVSEDKKENIINIWQKRKYKIDSEHLMLAMEPVLHDFFPVFYLSYFKIKNK